MIPRVSMVSRSNIDKNLSYKTLSHICLQIATTSEHLMKLKTSLATSKVPLDACALDMSSSLALSGASDGRFRLIEIGRDGSAGRPSAARGPRFWTLGRSSGSLTFVQRRRKVLSDKETSNWSPCWWFTRAKAHRLPATSASRSFYEPEQHFHFAVWNSNANPHVVKLHPST